MGRRSNLIEKINANSEEEKTCKIIIFLIAVLSIFLNQQKQLLGYNISISDFVAILLVLIYIFNAKLVIPRKGFFFFLGVSIITLSTAFFISPHRFNYVPNPNEIINNYIKLCSSFLYFLLGYNLFKERLIYVVYRWYSLGAITLGIIGIFMFFFKISIFPRQYFFQGPRYIGLMNDPNYFAVIQCTALVYFIRNKNIKKITLFMSYLVIFLSVVISSSKTGMLVFISYTIAIFIKNMLWNKNKKQIIRNFVIIAIIIVFLPSLSALMMKIIKYISTKYWSFRRVAVLFYDFNSAISEGGSGRDVTWAAALDIIKVSPLLGVGIGSYLEIMGNLQRVKLLAHNIYLQIFAEWGLILGSILFFYIFYLIFKYTFLNYSKDSDHSKDLNQQKNNYNQKLILRDIILILMIGSLSLSLNNARMFWIFFGALSNPKKITK